MKSKRSKACEIPFKVKQAVFERDGGHCLICGRTVPVTFSNAHYIARSHGGLGVEKNILTLCPECHERYDNSVYRQKYRSDFKKYLNEMYDDWDEKDLIYDKYQN
jgi:5-methylcytosine-specific restriction endonuclease McrA